MPGIRDFTLQCSVDDRAYRSIHHDLLCATPRSPRARPVEMQPQLRLAYGAPPPEAPRTRDGAYGAYGRGRARPPSSEADPAPGDAAP